VPLRLAATLGFVVLAAMLLAGCGRSSVTTGETRTDEAQTALPDKVPIGASAKSCDSYSTDAGSLRATGIACEQARQTMYGWQRKRSCSLPSGASRGSCPIRSYRCEAVRTDRGLAVSCARKGQSVAFLAKRRSVGR
jgi:hypothetical protein